jgi:hypothetical protein
MNLSLSTAADDVLGTGVAYGIGPGSVADSLTVTGQRFRTLPYVRFLLTLDFASGRVATYFGQLVAPNQLEGTWTEGNQQSRTVRFYRE